MLQINLAIDRSRVRTILWDKLEELGNISTYKSAINYIREKGPIQIVVSDEILQYELDQECRGLVVKRASDGDYIDSVCPYRGCEDRSSHGYRCEHLKKELSRIGSSTKKNSTWISKDYINRSSYELVTGVKEILDRAAQRRNKSPRTIRQNHEELCYSLGERMYVDHLEGVVVCQSGPHTKNIWIKKPNGQFEYLVCAHPGCDNSGSSSIAFATFCELHMSTYSRKRAILSFYNKTVSATVDSVDDITEDNWKKMLVKLWELGEEGYAYSEGYEGLLFRLDSRGWLEFRNEAPDDKPRRFRRFCVHEGCLASTESGQKNTEKRGARKHTKGHGTKSTARKYINMCNKHVGSETAEYCANLPNSQYGVNGRNFSSFLSSVARNKLKTSYTKPVGSQQLARRNSV